MTSLSLETGTLAACLTPPGTGAIATLAVRGPRAWSVVREVFHPLAPGMLPVEPEMGRFWLGRVGEPGQAQSDEVVVAVKRTAPEPWVEIHCHGGVEVVRWLLEILEERGIKVCSWQKLGQATEENALQAAAAAALAEAVTLGTAAILLDQHQGAFQQAVDEALAALRRDEEAKAGQILSGLARYANVGRHLTVPWRVTVLGAPNVGKSSLVNALAGYQRCVVAPTPGTTRDVVTTLIAVDGWPVELADTAGLRDGAQMLEEQGVGRARLAASAADLCLWVLDASALPVWPSLPRGAISLVVNKIDLPAAWDLSQASGGVQVSARTGSGLAELCSALAHWLVPDPPAAGAPVPFHPALCAGVEEALSRCLAGRLEQSREILEALYECLRNQRDAPVAEGGCCAQLCSP